MRDIADDITDPGELELLTTPADALVGEPEAALMQLFAGLNPERILGAAMAVGLGRYALDAAVRYAGERTVWKDPSVRTRASRIRWRSARSNSSSPS